MRLLNSNPDIKENLEGYFWVMDNASRHHANMLKDLFKNFNVCFNAPYSPFLNPIEECFALWKFNFRKGPAINKTNIFNQIANTFSILTSEKIVNFYRHSLSYFHEALLDKLILSASLHNLRSKMVDALGSTKLAH